MRTNTRVYELVEELFQFSSRILHWINSNTTIDPKELIVR